MKEVTNFFKERISSRIEEIYSKRYLKRQDSEYDYEQERRFKAAKLHKTKPTAEPADNKRHVVHVNGRAWKEFPTRRHAENVAKKIKGGTVVSEEFLSEVEDESKEKQRVKKRYVGMMNGKTATGKKITKINLNPTAKIGDDDSGVKLRIR